MLLDKSLLENGRFEPNYSDCSINRVISDVVDIMREQAALKQVALRFDVPNYDKVILRLDVQRTQQILINFL